MSYAVGAAIAALVAFGCAEPAPQYFEGTITSKSVVKDVFQNTETTSIQVEHSTENNYHGCPSGTFKVTGATKIAFLDDPTHSSTAADLEPGQVVRVTPAYTASDECPMGTLATSVTVIDLPVVILRKVK